MLRGWYLARVTGILQRRRKHGVPNITYPAHPNKTVVTCGLVLIPAVFLSLLLQRRCAARQASTSLQGSPFTCAHERSGSALKRSPTAAAA
jgi:hypothetical protein